MNYSAKSNMYEVNALSVLEAFGDFVNGTPEATVLVIGSCPATEAARTAIESSVKQLGYNAGACAWMTTIVDGLALGPEELGAITEGLDPLSVVCLDAEAALAFGSAYRIELPTDEASRVKGRTVVAFTRFDDLLSDSETKQRAWALLKRLRTA